MVGPIISFRSLRFWSHVDKSEVKIVIPGVVPEDDKSVHIYSYASSIVLSTQDIIIAFASYSMHSISSIDHGFES